MMYERREGTTGAIIYLENKPLTPSAIHVQMNEMTSSVECNTDKLASGAMEEKAMAKKKLIR